MARKPTRPWCTLASLFHSPMASRQNGLKTDDVHDECNPVEFTFTSIRFDPYITGVYAQFDGCIPSHISTRQQAFIIPWRYKNRKSGAISWKIFHLGVADIFNADCETIVVDPINDPTLRSAIAFVNERKKSLANEALIEFLLMTTRRYLGDYGLENGPSSETADARLFQRMLRQGHNFVRLCEVDIGLCRHKALLFKILCDVAGVSCALATGYSISGRHQWNVVTLPEKGDFLVDPTSPFFTWTKRGSWRLKGYRIGKHVSFGHAGLTQKLHGVL
ncbi:ethylene-responsive protein kinase Le-CTR1-domain-containing protein [Gaertneriomyces semiglobifer]|nr:ethylene-responsive protein kinase Le-CTR1-domain-containing protein [Gaertneriomyces semiglobifer]